MGSHGARSVALALARWLLAQNILPLITLLTTATCMNFSKVFPRLLNLGCMTIIVDTHADMKLKCAMDARTGHDEGCVLNDGVNDSFDAGDFSCSKDDTEFVNCLLALVDHTLRISCRG